MVLNGRVRPRQKVTKIPAIHLSIPIYYATGYLQPLINLDLGNEKKYPPLCNPLEVSLLYSETGTLKQQYGKPYNQGE